MSQGVPLETNNETIFRELGVYGLFSSILGLCGLVFVLIYSRIKSPDTLTFRMLQLAIVFAIFYVIWSTLRSLPLAFGFGPIGISIYHWNELKERIPWSEVAKIESINKGKAIWIVIEVNNHKRVELLSPLSKSRRQMLFDIFKANLSNVPIPE